MPSVPSSIPECDQKLIQELLDQKPAEFADLTLTQCEAFENGVLNKGSHLLVAETGNGKTFVAEAVAKKGLQNGDKVAYLVPSIALVGEKHATLSAWMPESVIVNKGRGYKEADVVVATFESFFEAVIRGYADRFDTVILDDFHEIYSTHRGPNIEKGISAALDKDMEMLGISATIGNPHTISRWLDAELTISSEKRAVPIEEIPIEKGGKEYAHQIAQIIRDNRDKGPFLVFNDTTSNAEARARGVDRQITFNLEDDVDFRSLVEEQIKTELTDNHEELIELLNNGIAYHHSRLEQGIKDLIEEYTEQGVIKCVFCTTTLSYGFDSPVQSVIVADLKRWDGYRNFIGVYEYVQWIGRAGRDDDLYDQAYTFLLYDDEDAEEIFQFDTPVEEKDIEDVTSHLSGQTALRWLVLELVNYGWETDVEVGEFVRSTLFWSENVDQVPDHIQADLTEQPRAELEDEIQETLAWLTRHGLLRKPIGQPQSEETRYTATELASALVKYEHNNWFDNSVREVLELTEWLAEKGEGLTPEALVQRLASEYYHCEEGGIWIEGEGPLSEKMDQYSLSGSEGATAVLTCWFWCDGVPITEIQEILGNENLSGLVNTTSNLNIAIESVRLLYEPFEMPEEPEWLGRFAKQVEAGVPGPDMYLISQVDYFGRALYNNLRDQLNRSGGSGSSWDPGDDHYIIERLSGLLAESGEDLFLEVVSSTRRIGDTISENILRALREWDPDSDERIDVPFTESAKQRPNSEGLSRYHERDGESTQGSENNSETDSDDETTTLNDFQ
jgi:replicative superfamily II helicase